MYTVHVCFITSLGTLRIYKLRDEKTFFNSKLLFISEKKSRTYTHTHTQYKYNTYINMYNM